MYGKVIKDGGKGWLLFFVFASLIEGYVKFWEVGVGWVYDDCGGRMWEEGRGEGLDKVVD